MIERFTPEARYIIARAQEEAKWMRHAEIGPQHFLTAIVIGGGPVAKALATLGVSAEPVHSRAAASQRRKLRPVQGSLPFSDATRMVLEHALKESMVSLSDQIGPEHLILGLFREGGAGAQILNDLGADRERTRNALRPLVGEAYFVHENPGESIDKFTDGAKYAITFTQEAARRFGHDHIDYLDLLIGVLYLPETLGPQALASLGVSVTALRRDAIAAAVRQPVTGGARPKIPTYILSHALHESADVAHQYIGAEHLLLAAVSSPAQFDVMVRHGISHQRLQEAVSQWRGRITEPELELGPDIALPPGFLSD